MESLSAFGADSQHRRLLRMHFPRGGNTSDAILLVNTLIAQEEISRDFRFDVEVLSDDASIPLKSMMAKMVTISMVRKDGTLRYFNGYVTEFRFTRTDGGFAFYNMVLEPWMAFLKLRKDCVSFQGRSTIELTEMTFAQHLQRDWKTRLYEDDPKLTYANQYNETDYNHLHRRWENQGKHYWYEHREDGHTLIIGDSTTMADAVDALVGADDGVRDVIPFHRHSGSLEDDGIHEWRAVRRIGSGSITLASFNYKNPRSHICIAHSLNKQGAVHAYERYENTGSYGYKDSRHGDTLAQRRMEALDATAQYFEGGGNDRSVQAGRSFRLGGHFSAEPRHSGRGKAPRASIATREYLILSVEHTASNNYQAAPGTNSHYENRFVCIRKSVRWRPTRHFNSEPCADPGMQTATVVGPPGEEIYTDNLGRVKLQFHWDRLGKFDDNSSPWIRVLAPLAGNYFGQSNIPRVKQEVAVLFLDGNIDLPVIVAGAYNSFNMPPWTLPKQRALSGFRSRELESGRRGNHVILDDTTDRIQIQIKSDHQHSQLSLGHITRIEDTEGRKDARGEGWELRTDGHGVARAAKGMLITTEARQSAGSHIKSMGETLQRLGAAQQQHEGLARLAQQHDAQAAEGQQSEVAAVIKAQNAALKGGAGDAAGFPELAAPHLVLASPAGIETTTSGSTHFASELDTAITTGKNLSFAISESLFASIRRTFRLFVHKAGMKMVAAAGDIDLQALSDGIKLLAKLDITLTANRITITAKEEVVINGGGSYARYYVGGIEQGTNGGFVAHAATHSLPGPKNMDMAMAMPPLSKLVGKGVLHIGSHAAASGRTSAGMPYTLYKNGAVIERGHIGEDGNMVFEHDLEAKAKYQIEFPNGQRYSIDPNDQAEQHQRSAGVGYHGYSNAGGSLSEEYPELKQDRLLADPGQPD